MDTFSSSTTFASCVELDGKLWLPKIVAKIVGSDRQKGCSRWLVNKVK